MAHVFLGPESAQDENSSFFPMFLLKNSTQIAQNLNFTQVFPRFFPQALLCGFSKLQLQTQATAQVGKSHSGRLRVWRFFLAKGQFLTVFTAFGDTYP